MCAGNEENSTWSDAPGELLFSLPTICDWMPPVDEKSRCTDRSLRLHEDDWRQAELVSYDCRDDIEAMLDSIYNIYQKARSPVGAFRKIYVRNRVPEPLSGRRIEAAELRNRFRKAVDYDALGYESSEGCVQGGFAWRTEGGLLIYGRRDGDALHALCLEIFERGSGLETDGKILEAFCDGNRLVLVDWCMCQALMPGDELFMEYFLPAGRGYRSIARRP
jgi:hypothetical protein